MWLNALGRFFKIQGVLGENLETFVFLNFENLENSS